MQYQFENVQSYDQKMYLEFAYKVRHRRTVLWGYAWLVIAAMDLYRALTEDSMAWLFAAFSLALAANRLLLPYFKEKQRAKDYFDFYDGESAPARVRFGDIIRIEDHSAVMHMDYEQIRQVILLKRGLFLRYQEGAYLAIDPNSFTKGTYEGFKQFLREKRPDLKIPE